MNLLYEELFTAFLEKAQIERDAIQIAHTLKKAFPNCHLPVDKTIKRVLKGETAHPRESLLGFLSAFVLDIQETEVLLADQKNKLGDFYKLFEAHIEQKATLKSNSSAEVIQNTPQTSFPAQKDRAKTIALWVLGIAVLSLIGYIWYAQKKASNLLMSVPFPNMIPLKGGTVAMSDGFNDGFDKETVKPLRSVILNGFEMSQTEITFELFDMYCAARNIPLRDDLGWGREGHPAIMMDWYEAADFCNWLSEVKGLKPVYTLENTNSSAKRKVTSNLDNDGYRLPTEAEWEYAALTDIKSNTPCSFEQQKTVSEAKKLEDNPFYNRTVPVLESGKNQNELYGMFGNVAEWCHDFYTPHSITEDNNVKKPNEASIKDNENSIHVLRGGVKDMAHSKTPATKREWSPASCRSMAFGFRIVKKLTKEQQQMAFMSAEINTRE